MRRALGMVVAEGRLDEVAARRLAEVLDISIDGPVFNTGGVHAFWKRLPKYNDAARAAAGRSGPVFALADHDSVGCVGPTITKNLPQRHPHLILRLCVAELEAWLLADATALASFLRVSAGKIPRDPDREPNPKETLVNLARGSTRAEIRQGLVPKPGHSGVVGAEYTLVMEHFVRTRWQPRHAAKRSPSLRRAISALEVATSA